MKQINRKWIAVILCILLAGSLLCGAWTWYDTNVDRSGWFTTEDGQLYYKNFHGRRLSGWQEIGTDTYFFREDGTALTGWQDMEDGRRYFGTDGVLVTGWAKVDGRRYFDEDGRLAVGWLELDGSTYYLPEGVLATYWKTIEGKKYYFGKDGAMATGFTDIGKDRYYFEDDGVLVTGERELEGQLYLFEEDGKMVSGWHDTEEGRRYYGPGMALGWQEIEGKRYRFDEEGILLLGWYTEGEYRYYFGEDGAAAVGPNTIDGQTHYFTPKGIEVVLVNAKNSVPKWYKADLVTFVSWYQVDRACQEALRAMLADCKAAGIEYEFNSAYRTIGQQQEILRARTQSYMENYGLSQETARSRALRTVALPGTSEHHLGLAVDLLGDEAQAWLQEHCWDYGFILRYLPGKEGWTGIASEPWHFRYVGKEIALELKENGLTLEEYLGAAPVKAWMLEQEAEKETVAVEPAETEG